MAFQLYVDDSGKNDPPIFVLAGFLATHEAWSEFAVEWQEALAGPPELSYFKMKEANRCNGAFKGFTKQQRDERLVQLAKIVQKHVEFGISIGIPHAIYNKVFRGRMMETFDTPYTLAFYLIQGSVHKYLLKAGNRDVVDLVFDRQLDRENQILASHHITVDGMPSQILERFPRAPEFMDDKQALPLQAADLLAWHIRRSWKDGRDKLPTLSAAGPVLKEMLIINELCREKDLEHFFDVGMSKVMSMNTLPPHAAKTVRESFDLLATEANVEVMEKAIPFAPIEMVSFPAIGMEKYLFVRSCAACDNPHLHKRLGNRCLSEQTAVEWPPASHSS